MSTVFDMVMITSESIMRIRHIWIWTVTHRLCLSHPQKKKKTNQNLKHCKKSFNKNVSNYMTTVYKNNDDDHKIQDVYFNGIKIQM